MILQCNLKRILEERKLSMREFSRQSDITFETIRKLCDNRTRQYAKDTIEKVCTTLNIEVSDLLTLTDEDNKKEDAT
ncbi:helix-turn-helix domain-containing protein [Gracilibacillus marinus]|uniref:Helix-turn-helix domain-containing protein n=1 Tax=Gracilibacillus marinus TaxID=630535 RepID=A0ABV8VU73_9BACI